MTRRGALVAIAATTVVLLASCGVPLDSSPQPLGADDIPAGLRPPDPDVSAPATAQVRADVWFVNGDRLVDTLHLVPSPPAPSGVIAALLVGPSDTEQDRALRSAIPDSAAVVGVTVAGGVANVRLRLSFADIPVSDQVLAVGQLVLTLTDLRGIGRVQFFVAGSEVAVPLPNGDTSSGSVSRDDYLELALSTS